MMPTVLSNLSNVLNFTTSISSNATTTAAMMCNQLVVHNDLDLADGIISTPEKLAHLLYLKSFRTEPCQKFREHRCVYHKPYMCFNWHFPNQRRRRPFRLRNGHFNYSPDVYCDHYDENTGHCPNGDECPYLHKNAGDTERRYHMRYFRSLMCNNDRDISGKCVRNGPHCAFAHGADDLRQPVYDIRELAEAAEYSMNLPACLEKERVLSEDPSWNDMQFVLSHYKTEPCKRSPRMCRQGYACPFYHNAKDKRRDPLVNKYKSTPCPTVKNSEEWGDPEICELANSCGYCHTRTEQQFHPEIYKSTKCNDMLHQRYCPRGPFCAFAHIDSEMNFGRDFITVGGVGASAASSPLNSTLSISSEEITATTRIPVVTANAPTTTFVGSWGAPGSSALRTSLNSLLSGSATSAAVSQAQATIFEQAIAGGSSSSKGRSLSGGSANSVESGLGSLLRGDTPPRFRRTPPPAIGRLSGGTTPSLLFSGYGATSSASPAPQEDDLDLEDIMQRFGLASHETLPEEESEGDSAADLDLPIFGAIQHSHRDGSAPIGIPGTISAGGSICDVGSTASSLGSSYPFAPIGSKVKGSGSGSGFRSSISDRSGTPNFPQSPIMVQTVFSNAAADLDRLAGTPSEQSTVSDWIGSPQCNRLAATLEYRIAAEAEAYQSARRLADTQTELLNQLAVATAAAAVVAPRTSHFMSLPPGAAATLPSLLPTTSIPSSMPIIANTVFDQLTPDQVAAMKTQLLAYMQMLNMVQPNTESVNTLDLSPHADMFNTLLNAQKLITPAAMTTTNSDKLTQPILSQSTSSGYSTMVDKN